MTAPTVLYRLNIDDYITSRSPWPGILRHLRDRSSDQNSAKPTDDQLTKQLLKTAKHVLTDTKEYDTFRKSLAGLRDKKTLSLKKDNLFRLLFVLGLPSDTEAQQFLNTSLHCNLLSPRALDEFIVISALKLGLSWSETHRLLYDRYAAQIRGQDSVPDNLDEGYTQLVYLHVIDRLKDERELLRYLDEPGNTYFFAKTGNTLYKALFFDASPITVKDADGQTSIRLVDDTGEAVTVEDYRRSLFGLASNTDEDILSLTEIDALSAVFEDVFMTESSFYKLVSRKNLSSVSSGTFLMSFLARIDTEDETSDYYVDFRSSDEDFRAACDEWLLYYGFPCLNPDCGSFDKLLLDVLCELRSQLSTVPDLENAALFDAFLAALRHYLREILRRS